MTCTCKDWQENIRKINDPIELNAIRSGTKGYDGVFFKYCPWCGKELNEHRDNIITELLTLDGITRPMAEAIYEWHVGKISLIGKVINDEIDWLNENIFPISESIKPHTKAVLNGYISQAIYKRAGLER